MNDKRGINVYPSKAPSSDTLIVEKASMRDVRLTAFSKSSTTVCSIPSGSFEVSPGTSRIAASLRKRKASNVTVTPLQQAAGVTLKPGKSILDQIGRPDHAGWLRKKSGRYYSTWKLRYFVLKGPQLFYISSDRRSETELKGHITVIGYKVMADGNANPGEYGFKIVHDNEPSHFFSSEDKMAVREWMKALLKVAISRDISKPTISSCNIPTIPLEVAQSMVPAPRPPSPTTRAMTQKALRREDSDQFSSRDARVLMGLVEPGNDVPPPNGGRGRLESFLTSYPLDVDNTIEARTAVPSRPSPDMWQPVIRGDADRMDPISDEMELVDWANSVLPKQYHIHDLRKDLSSGIVLLRLAETVGGKQIDPPVLDSEFLGDNRGGMFILFDFLLGHDVKLGNVSIVDVRQGRPDKIVQLLKEIKAMGEKRKAVG